MRIRAGLNCWTRRFGFFRTVNTATLSMMNLTSCFLAEKMKWFITVLTISGFGLSKALEEEKDQVFSCQSLGIVLLASVTLEFR